MRGYALARGEAQLIAFVVRTWLVAAAAVLLTPCAALAGRDPNSPILHPVASDVRAAKSLLVTQPILGSNFKASPSGTSPNNNSGSCAGFDPNLRALTETAEEYGDLLTDRREGLLFTSEAEVYVSPVEAAKSQTLQTSAGAGRCVASLAKQAAGTTAVILKKKVTPVSFTRSGLRVKAWDAVLLVRVSGRRLPVEATLFVYRRARAVSFLFVSGLESQAIARYTQAASAQMVSALLRANVS